MRLLQFSDSGDIRWEVFDDSSIPPYAILSHTWDKEEVLFTDLTQCTYRQKAGFEKIGFCKDQIARDSLQYVWIDTCCIDKRDLNELSKSINSMFRYSRNAAKCYVYLSDVSTSRAPGVSLYQTQWEESFRRSRWFTRGWTLQELIAPLSVEFFSKEHEQLGDKISLVQQIFAKTGIPRKALEGHPLHEFSPAQRMTWAANRATKEEEDGAYCLLGLFGVAMVPIYGEGIANAMRRLLKEIAETSAEGVSCSRMYIQC
jgi:hypothetical protein